MNAAAARVLLLFRDKLTSEGQVRNLSVEAGESRQLEAQKGA